MESKARLIDISKDWKSGKFRLTFEVDSFLPNMVDAIKDVCLRLSVKKWKEKRSLDANGYMWVLLSKLSEKLNEQGTGTDPQKLYEHYLRYYGVLAKDEDGHISITIRSRIDIDNVPGHWRLYKKSPDLKMQVEYELIPRLTLPDGHIQRKTVYKADFTYKDRTGKTHVVDAKGIKTDVYKLKKKLMYAVHKIVIEEV